MKKIYQTYPPAGAKSVYLNLTIVSASIISFEIISTRVTSVIFVSNYAFIILSLAILGLGSGGIYAFYKIKTKNEDFPAAVFRFLIITGSSIFLFITAVIILNITNPFFYFLFLFIPFFFAGIVYSLFFKTYAENSFKIYASDLSGAALGAIASLFLINFLGASNAILFLSIVILLSAGLFMSWLYKKKQTLIYYLLFSVILIFITINGQNNFLGKIPIGKFPEKDFYYVYPDADAISEVIESRWSLFGRSDLVQYTNQDIVKQLFIDGAAGSQMYRFNGNVQNPGSLLYNLLIYHTNSIPFLFIPENEKNNMLIIGPGGGKEVLIGLFGGVDQITGIEVNPDFVNIVKDYKDFNGGIYTDFPNVEILVAEGRNYIKHVDKEYDLIVMALPSTEQLQSIDNLAMNENYLLTTEAIEDYLRILTPEGSLILTVHNRWELLRLIITSFEAFKKSGISNQEALNHFLILEQNFNPTIMIKKNPFSRNDSENIANFIKTIPEGLPAVTYLPFTDPTSGTEVNRFLSGLKKNSLDLTEFIQRHPYDISPCRDDSPYFYKINTGIPGDFLYLFSGVALVNILVIGIPFSLYKKRILKERKKKERDRKVILRNISFPAIVFACLGAGFMLIEISLFQKLILYLGSPTTSLAILLGSILIGMGSGSYYGSRIYGDDHYKRLYTVALLILFTGIIFFAVYPFILGNLLKYSLLLRGVVSFIMILPFGFLLGIPFPTSIQIVKKSGDENLIPWLYGINGTMSVFGSVFAGIMSMLYGFTVSFSAGLFFYFCIFFIVRKYSKNK